MPTNKFVRIALAVVKDLAGGNYWIAGFKDVQATRRNTLDVDHCRRRYWTRTCS